MKLRKMTYHFVENIFKCIFLKENICILIQFQSYVPEEEIVNISALLKVIARRRLKNAYCMSS